MADPADSSTTTTEPAALAAQPLKEPSPTQPLPSQERPDWITTVEKGGDRGGEKRSD